MIRYDLRRLLSRSAIVALCLVCLGAFHTSVNATFSHAQSSSGWGVDWRHGYMGPSGQWAPAPSGVTGGGAGWSHGSTGVSGAATGRISNGPGYIDVDARVSPSSSRVAAALGRFARKGLPVVGTAVALRDLMDELGFDSSDGVTWRKSDPAVCTVSPCYSYTSSLFSPSQSAPSCSGLTGKSGPAAGTTGTITITSAFLEGANCRTEYISSRGSCCGGTAYASQSTVPPSPPSWLPSTEDEFIDAIASKSGWPSSSAISRAVAEAADAGEKPEGPVTVTGPATSPGPKTTSTDSSGNVTERQTVYNYTYNGGNISYTTTVITVVNGTQTTTETIEGEPPQSECDGRSTVGCADLDTPQTDVPKSERTISYAPEDLGLGGGACPAPIPINTSRGSWSLDLAPYCDATTTYVRPMVILVAMFVAYLIITGHRFGGD